MLPIQSQIFMTEDNEDLFLTFSTCPMSSAHPDHSGALTRWKLYLCTYFLQNLGQEKGQDKLNIGC